MFGAFNDASIFQAPLDDKDAWDGHFCEVHKIHCKVFSCSVTCDGQLLTYPDEPTCNEERGRILRSRESVAKSNAQYASQGFDATPLPCGDAGPSPCDCASGADQGGEGGTGGAQGKAAGSGGDTSPAGLINSAVDSKNKDTGRDVAAAKAGVDAQNKDRNDTFKKFHDGMNAGTDFKDRPMSPGLPKPPSDRPGAEKPAKGLSSGVEKAGSSLDKLLD